MLKWSLVGLAAIFALALAALAALPWIVDTPAVRAQVAQLVGHALGRPVRFASLSFSAFPLPSVRLKDLRVAEDPAFGSGPFVTIAEGRIRIRLRPLLSGRVEFSSVTLDAPQIAVVEDAAGRLNVASLGIAPPSASASPRASTGRGGAGSASVVLLSSVRVTGGTLTYQKIGGGRPAISIGRIEATLRQDAPGEALVLSGEAIAEPGAIKLTTKDARVSPGASRAIADVVVRAAVDVSAPDVAPVAALVVSTPRLAGPLKGRIDLAGTLGRLSATGGFDLDRASLSSERPGCGTEPRRLAIDALKLPLSLTPSRVESTPVEARVARGTVSLRATLALGAQPSARLTDISAKGVELAPVLVDYLCQPYAVTGPLDLTGEATLRGLGAETAEAMRGVDGSGRFRIGSGKVVGREVVSLVREVVGLGSAVAAVTRPGKGAPGSPLDFDSITATYTITNGVARTDDLVYKARDVRVTAAGTYALGDRRVAMEITLTEGVNQVKAAVTGGPGSLRVVPIGARLQDRDIKRFLDRLFR